MKHTVDTLRCGECSGAEFSLTYATIDGAARFGGGGRYGGEVIARCLKCNSETQIGPAPPALVSHGPLCGGWSG